MHRLCGMVVCDRSCEPGRQSTRCAFIHGKNLKECSHLVRARQALDRGVDDGRILRIVMRQPIGSCADSQCCEKISLRQRTKHAGSGFSRHSGERAEIDMSRQVGFARVLERISEGVVAHRLQRVSSSSFRVTVVDEQRDAACVGDPIRNTPGELRCRRIHFDDRAFRAR